MQNTSNEDIWAKKFKFHAGNQKFQVRNCQFGTFDSLHGIWNFVGPNTFI
jgi:hypothetical protein